MHDSDCHGNFGLLKVVRRHIQLSFAVKRDWNAQIEKTCKIKVAGKSFGGG